MPQPPSANLHDAFFKQLMSAPETAGQFVRERLPPDVAALLADGPPELVPGSFIDRNLAQHHSDVLLRMDLAAGGDILLHILIEHKSAPDPLVPLQVLGYLVRIWEGWRDTGQGRPLPPVVPVVVYHGIRAWSVPTAFTGMFGELPAALRRHLPEFDYVLVNLRRIADDRLSRHLRLRAFLTVMKYILHPGLPGLLDLVLAEAVRLDMVDVVLILTYIDKGPVDVAAETVRAALRRLAPARAEEIMGTLGQSYFDQGLAKGKAEGLAKGKAEGKAETLIRLLTRRFGPLPEDVRRRVAAADAETLDHWAELVLDAPDLDTVFGRATSH